jgi:hypothetical protein
MKLIELKSLLKLNSTKKINFEICGKRILSHFHITEAGKVTKNFVDCGGKRREKISCVIQIWVADDFEHRVDSEKMLKILNFADFFHEENPNVEIEYGEKVISQYQIKSFRMDDEQICFEAFGLKTDCLAPEKCGLGCERKERLVTIQKKENKRLGGVRVVVNDSQSTGYILRRLNSEAYEIWLDDEYTVKVLSPNEFTEVGA